MWQAFPASDYYTPSDFLTSVSTPSLLRLSVDTPVPRRVARISHVYLTALIACHALRPRRSHLSLPGSDAGDGAFETYHPLGLLAVDIR